MTAVASLLMAFALSLLGMAALNMNTNTRLWPASWLTAIQEWINQRGATQLAAYNLNLTALSIMVMAIGWLLSQPAITVLGLCFCLWPWMQVVESGRRRQQHFQALWPSCLQLLALSIKAGLEPSSAFMRLCHQIQSLEHQWKPIRSALELGHSLPEALKRSHDQSALPEIKSFSRLLKLSLERGMPLSELLEQESRELQHRRFTQNQERAQKAPVHLLGPLILLIMPGVFLVILTPILLPLI